MDHPSNTCTDLNVFLIARLKHLALTSDHDQIAFLGALEASRQTPSKRELRNAGGPPSSVRVIQHGYCCRQMGLSDGRRQVTEFIIPGDICDVRGATATEHRIHALTPVIHSEVKRQALARLVNDHPRIGEALGRSAALNDAMLYERLVSLGRRSAKERLAHFFCEVFVRSRAVALTRGSRCSLPLGQADLADLLGLSLVHTNRSVKALRSEGLVQLQRQILTIHDFNGLQEISKFDPHYLQLGRDAPGPGTSRPPPFTAELAM